jgi:hypothetical protein
MAGRYQLYWTGGVLNAVSKLPYELQREVYNLIDFDTKLSVIMDRYPTMQRLGQRRDDDKNEWNDIFEWFTEKELSVIYRQGYLCKLFQYNERSRRWQLKPTFVNRLPQTTIYGYTQASITNVSGEPQLIETPHPVYDMIDNLRTQDISSVKTRLQLSLTVLQNTDVRDREFNYYIRKVAFQLILASNVYKRTCIRARQMREAEQQQLNLEREQARIVKMAQRQIEIEEERRILQAEKEVERQRAATERADIFRIREEEKQLRQQERQQAKLEKEAQLIARIQEREENIQRKQILQREMEEKRERSNQQRIAQQKAKEEERMFKLTQKTERENAKREKTEQKRVRQQARLDKLQQHAAEKKRKMQLLAMKREASRQKLYEQTLVCICKLFR